MNMNMNFLAVATLVVMGVVSSFLIMGAVGVFLARARLGGKKQHNFGVVRRNGQMVRQMGGLWSLKVQILLS